MLLPCVLLLGDVKTVRLNVFPCVRATDAVPRVRRPFGQGVKKNCILCYEAKCVRPMFVGMKSSKLSLMRPSELGPCFAALSGKKMCQVS